MLNYLIILIIGRFCPLRQSCPYWRKEKAENLFGMCNILTGLRLWQKQNSNQHSMTFFVFIIGHRRTVEWKQFVMMINNPTPLAVKWTYESANARASRYIAFTFHTNLTAINWIKYDYKETFRGFNVTSKLLREIGGKRRSCGSFLRV